ncbi:MAG TPA: endonuclease/exonuclease/phosphatase family protein [Chitinophagaceae bacterium]|nr:endonuclease/exonuclease/phosphatase family protein [Chitinophagaceae bacterium]
MASKFRSFIRKVLIVLSFLVAVIFLLACLAPYFNPVTWWFISWLGFIFPFLLLLLILSIIFWLFVEAKYAVLFLIVMLTGWKSISVFFAFHLPHKFNYSREPGVLRVVTWNVARFIEIKKNSNSGSQIRLKMMDQLRDQNADVLCLQEFHSAAREGYYDNISYIQKELNYPYYYFSFDEDGSKLYYSSIIFSRLPLFDTGKIVYPKPSLQEPLLHADINFNGDTIRIFTSHLQSVQFKRSDYTRIDEIKHNDDSLLSNSRTIFSKLKRGIVYRSVQANIIKDQLKESDHPIIFCGDFNDVPNSYTYFTVRGNMQDAFLQKGSAIGRTFTSISPTLRIDYILASKEFSILQFNRLVKNYSDHYMLVTDLKLPPDQE